MSSSPGVTASTSGSSGYSTPVESIALPPNNTSPVEKNKLETNKVPNMEECGVNGVNVSGDEQIIINNSRPSAVATQNIESANISVSISNNDVESVVVNEAPVPSESSSNNSTVRENSENSVAPVPELVGEMAPQLSQPELAAPQPNDGAMPLLAATGGQMEPAEQAPEEDPKTEEQKIEELVSLTSKYITR